MFKFKRSLLCSLLLMLTLSGCSNLQPSAEVPSLLLPTSPPSVYMPQPQGTYMNSVEKNIEAWDLKLKKSQTDLGPSKGTSTQ